MAFSFTKKRPPTDTQIRRHRDQVRLRAQWKDDTGRIQGISAKMASTYANHKGDFALGRYEELKQMIKDAIKEYRDLVEKTQKHSREGATSAMASKYSGNANSSHGNGSTPSSQSDSGATGLFAKLKQKAVDFASSATTSSSPASSPTTKEEQKEKEMETWGYEGRNAKVIEEETETFRKEVLQLKADFRAERDKLERLSKDYEDSKKHAPPQRYTVLKFMIKDHIGA